ncbi:tetratricopeptide repeat protein [Streptomyces sp. S07_1.15]|uniref:tetratricopeptide repeat protein n=1 Tax=Streptomyces sp. S07_1.15 TaxID=2873925 RepID=UPI001D134582|nr:tetratricopeptide repeat protein [Streptomyces sp. S07_1.15]MCC3654643.1 tetratricopeptide repeat protein [Streptomyces sp. S07_1.15]
MDPVTVPQLTAALIGADRRRTARPALVEIVRAAAAPGDLLSRALASWETSPGDPFRAAELAELLAARAASRPGLTEELRLWVLAATPRADDSVHANTLGGTARISGAVLQSRDIHGGVHIHSAEPAGPPRGPVPRQLLPVPADFGGRDSDLRALEALRRETADGPAPAPLRVVISGPAGVGKTTLASHWLTGLAGNCPDGQLYTDLRGHSPTGGPAAPGEVLGQFLRAFGSTHIPSGLDEQAALWRSVTAGLRIAVLLDNALSAAQVRPLLPGSASSLVVVTSRRRLTGLVVDGAVFHHVEPLRPEAAVALLTSRVGAHRVGQEPEAARRVAALCAGLPLAVSVAAARMAARPRQSLTVMAAALDRDAGSRLEPLRAEGSGAVRTALDESYRTLPADVARAYRCLGTQPVTVFDSTVAAAACGTSRAEAERVLDDLVEVNLLEDLTPDPVGGGERYRFHDLIRAHADDLAGREDSPADRDAAVRRVVDVYLAAATAAEALLTPSHRTLRRDYVFPPAHPVTFADSRAALQWLDGERLHLMAVLRAAAGREWHDAVWQLTDAMWPLFLRLRPYDLWTEAHGIGLDSACRAGDRTAEKRMLTSGGAGLRNDGRHDEAAEWFGRSLELARQDGDVRAEAQALHGLGQSLRLAGHLERAIPHLTRALELREEIGYRRGAALTRLVLGDIAQARGRPHEAVTLLTAAREALLAESDAYDAARALAFLGRAHARAHGDPAAAEELLHRAHEEFLAAGSVHWQARVLEFLGQTAAEGGDTEKAGDHYERSLALYAPVSSQDARRLAARLQSLHPGGPSRRNR